MHAVYVARTPLTLFEYHLPIQKSYKSREHSHSHNIDLGFDMLAVERCSLLHPKTSQCNHVLHAKNALATHPGLLAAPETK